MDLTEHDRARLVEWARAAVEAEVRGRTPPAPGDLEGALAERRGCFVTLTNAGRLRGCIGTFRPQEPLGQQIVEMGAAAARDPRFTMNPITPPELGEIHVEVSVLSPLAKTDRPEQLTPGVHGVYIVRGTRAGCFLPEVATQMGWGAEEFLDQCCTGKAGLAPGAWREPGTDVYLFTSEKFGE